MSLGSRKQKLGEKNWKLEYFSGFPYNPLWFDYFCVRLDVNALLVLSSNMAMLEGFPKGVL